MTTTWTYILPTLCSVYVCVSRYITALTDSEDDELSDTEQEASQEQPEDKCKVLLEKVDRLHQGTESDKRESLDILLEQREEVHNFHW